jgi:hypothetical protein
MQLNSAYGKVNVTLASLEASLEAANMSVNQQKG